MGIAMNYQRNKFDSFVIFLKREYDFGPKKKTIRIREFQLHEYFMVNIAKTAIEGLYSILYTEMYMYNYIYIYCTYP